MDVAARLKVSSYPRRLSQRREADPVSGMASTHRDRYLLQSAATQGKLSDVNEARRPGRERARVLPPTQQRSAQTNTIVAQNAEPQQTHSAMLPPFRRTVTVRWSRYPTVLGLACWNGRSSTSGSWGQARFLWTVLTGQPSPARGAPFFPWTFLPTLPLE